MYHHILIPTDGSELSGKAIDQGVALAKALGAQVTGVTVTIPFHIIALDPATVRDTRETYATRVAQTGEKYLGAVKNAAVASDVKCDTIRVEDEHPYHAIIDTAEKQGCDAIVMASHGRSGISAGPSSR